MAEKNIKKAALGMTIAAGVLGTIVGGPYGALLALSTVGSAMASGSVKDPEARKQLTEQQSKNISKLKNMYNERNY